MSTLTLNKIQIGKSSLPAENLVIHTTIAEPDGIIKLSSGTIESIIKDLIELSANGTKLFNPSVIETVASNVISKEIVSAEWVLAKIAAISDLIPTGTVFTLSHNTIPSGYLKCNGAAVSRTTYANLFARISNIYGNGDGTTTFNVPDFRGEFIRGWDDSRGIDSGRGLGSAQAAELQSHRHDLLGARAYAVSLNDIVMTALTPNNTGQGSPQSPVTGLTGGTETRPRNIAQQFIIKT